VLWNWILLTYLWLRKFQTNQWMISGSIIVIARIVCVLAGVLMENGPNRSSQTMTQGYCVIFCYFGWEQPICLTVILDILDKWNINNQCSTSCVRPGHVTVFLIVFSFLVYPGWSKYSWYQDSTLCLNDWLM
jgi:hypothetical protein